MIKLINQYILSYYGKTLETRKGHCKHGIEWNTAVRPETEIGIFHKSG